MSLTWTPKGWGCRNDGTDDAGHQVIVLYVSSDRDIDAAFATIIQRGAGALLSLGGAFFNSHRERLVALAARHALPVTYPWREATVAGGLMSYGTSINPNRSYA
jgi:putative ABC transport system substrate-binding protein